MGKNISVYLNDELLGMVESHGMPASKVIQAALKNYFQSEKRASAHNMVIKSAKTIGAAGRFGEAVDEWAADRERDRW